MAADKRSYGDFPASEDKERKKDSIIEKAMRKSNKDRLIPKPEGEDRGSEVPKGKRVKRAKADKPERPEAEKSKATASPEVERGSSISAALLKGAALTPDFSYSGTLRGLLGGASVGMDIDTALTQYRQKKAAETAASAAMSMGNKGMPKGETPSNVPLGMDEERKRKGYVEVE